jgi:sulfur-oxidizing protein SoxY
MKRRLFLKTAMAGSAIATAIGAGLLIPRVAFANSSGFKSKSNSKALLAEGAKHGVFKFKAPKIAENGAVVPITIDASKIDNVKSVSIIIEANSTPLAASFAFSGALGYVSTRVKMGKSSNVIALVETDKGLYKKVQEVKVTIGGCGG